MVNVQKVWWKRSGYVAIEDRNGNMVKYGGSHSALDFKFSGEKYGDLSTNFKVSILGLSLETIKSLTVWNRWEAALNPRRIQVFAGYDTDSLANPIFDGFIFNALPTIPPNMWLEMECRSFMKDTSPITPFTVTDTGWNILTLIGNLFNSTKGAQGIKVAPMEETKIAELERTMTFHFEGCPIQIASDFAEKTGGMIYHEDGVMYWIREDAWNHAKFVASSAKTINLSNGMIDIPKIDYKGATIRRRLNDDIPIMKWIKLESELVPSANGYYFVAKKRHVGHFRGDDWYTEIETIRRPNYGGVEVQRADGSWYGG